MKQRAQHVYLNLWYDVGLVLIKYNLHSSRYEIPSSSSSSSITVVTCSTHLEWPDLDNKNLSKYCMKYLQHCVPTKTADNANGTQIISTLYYNKVNTNIISNIVVVQCKIRPKTHTLIYYMTRALKPHCVYALKCTGSGRHCIFIIINKYCNFENKPSNWLLKQKRGEMISMIHRETGQPIAKDKYLLKYELEHQTFLKRKRSEGKHMEWPHVTIVYSLDAYCYEYVKECAPRRNPIGIRGNLRTEKLHYQKLNINENIYVTVVQCQLDNARKTNYFVTEAPETNCAYGLLWELATSTNSLVIVFKYCHFVDSNIQKIHSQDCSRIDENVMISKTEVKGEPFDTLDALPLFPSE